jgi:hypothetical protein
MKTAKYSHFLNIRISVSQIDFAIPQIHTLYEFNGELNKSNSFSFCIDSLSISTILVSNWNNVEQTISEKLTTAFQIKKHTA